MTLKRQGGSYWACCPFHNEKTPSFHVVPSRGIYKCFGCGKAGSAVGFLMEYERLSYSEALRYLANKYHIEIQEKEETAEEIAARQRNESLLAVSDFAFHFYKDQLKTTEGRSVGYQYFRSRGLEDETIEKYGLGWAPKGKSAFTEAAREAGYKAEYLTETGLCSEWDDGSLHDRFYDRVMFPIHSVSGRVIAFGGRTLLSDKSVAKYVNSKESEIYVKSRSLYGIYFAKNEIAKRDRVYLVEGYLDVLSFHQLGLLNTVASSGTSLTVEQIRLMKRFSENVTIMYDGDPAGIHAALRGIDMVLKEGMNVKVVLFTDGDDPDSFSRKHTLEEVETFIARNEQDFTDGRRLDAVFIGEGGQFRENSGEFFVVDGLRGGLRFRIKFIGHNDLQCSAGKLFNDNLAKSRFDHAEFAWNRETHIHLLARIDGGNFNGDVVAAFVGGGASITSHAFHGSFNGKLFVSRRLEFYNSIEC